MTQALVFTRTKHRANRLAEYLEKQGVKAARIHGNRSQAQRTQALAGFKSGKYPVLVATDIAARGIDVEATRPRRQLRRAGRARGLHPPRRPHRARRGDRRGVHLRVAARKRTSGSRSRRPSASGCRASQLPDFDYTARPDARLEIPIAERIAAIRKRKAEERARAQAKAAARAARPAPAACAERRPVL